MTSLPETHTLQLELSSGWLTIRLNTPENRNALSSALAAELRSTLEAVRDDRTIRGITLRGNGGIFCAGGDLKAFMAGLQGNADQSAIAVMNRSGGELFHLIATMPQIVVALIEGAAIAGGLGMACCADIVVVTKDAKFALTETQLGITPAQIAPYVVQRVGFITAKRLMLTGARFTGDEAEAIGLADYVVDNATGLDEVMETIKHDVQRCAPGANATTKELLLKTQHHDQSEMIDIAADYFAQCLLSEEGREGITAYIAKRKPHWATQSEQE